MVKGGLSSFFKGQDSACPEWPPLPIPQMMMLHLSLYSFKPGAQGGLLPKYEPDCLFFSSFTCCLCKSSYKNVLNQQKQNKLLKALQLLFFIFIERFSSQVLKIFYECQNVLEQGSDFFVCSKEKWGTMSLINLARAMSVLGSSIP